MEFANITGTKNSINLNKIYEARFEISNGFLI